MKGKLRDVKNGLVVQESVWEGFSDDEIISAYKELDDSPGMAVVWDGENFVAKGEQLTLVTSDSGESWTLRESP